MRRGSIYAIIEIESIFARAVLDRHGSTLVCTSEFWINLQTRYDLDVADRTVRRLIEQEISPRTA
jgi:plasmid maintenance system antidote protein VapI